MKTLNNYVKFVPGSAGTVKTNTLAKEAVLSDSKSIVYIAFEETKASILEKMMKVNKDINKVINIYEARDNKDIFKIIKRLKTFILIL